MTFFSLSLARQPDAGSAVADTKNSTCYWRTFGDESIRHVDLTGRHQGQ